MNAAPHTFAILLLLASITLDAQNYSLVETLIAPNPDDVAPVVDANAMGGSMTFTRTYRSGCVGNYNIKWTFSKNVEQLKDGDKFSVTIQCINCNSPCGYKWTSASASGANNIHFPINGKYDTPYNQNIKAASSTGSVHNWYPGHLTHTTEFEVAYKKEAEYTGFYIAMGDHRVYYIYRFGNAPSDAINCHTLLGLGKNLFSLEVGALNGYDIEDWMLPTIERALVHIEASNCLSADYLTALKSRIAPASSSQLFYSEIQSYSASVETEVATSCSCCSACTNR